MNLQHLRVVDHPAGATLVKLDVKDKRLNVLNDEVFSELDQVVAHLGTLPRERPVFLSSAKEKGFVVGADLRHLRELNNAEALDRFLKKGQETMDSWSQLPNPTVAWVRGMALGGGLELALSCRYLLVSQGADTQLGLPESKLGLLPGWGGTQLLPRRIGLEPALKLLWTGEPVDAARAQELGLAEGSWSANEESTHLETWIETIGKNSLQPKAPRPTQKELAEQLARWDKTQPPWAELLGETVEEDIRRARLAILRAVSRGVDQGIQAGKDEERHQFWPLLADLKVQARLERFAPKK